LCIAKTVFQVPRKADFFYMRRLLQRCFALWAGLADAAQTPFGFLGFAAYTQAVFCQSPRRKRAVFCGGIFLQTQR